MWRPGKEEEMVRREARWVERRKTRWCGDLGIWGSGDLVLGRWAHGKRAITVCVEQPFWSPLPKGQKEFRDRHCSSRSWEENKDPSTSWDCLQEFCPKRGDWWVDFCAQQSLRDTRWGGCWVLERMGLPWFHSLWPLFQKLQALYNWDGGGRANINKCHWDG